MGVAFANDYRSRQTGTHKFEAGVRCAIGGAEWNGVLTLRGSGDRHTNTEISAPFDKMTVEIKRLEIWGWNRRGGGTARSRRVRLSRKNPPHPFIATQGLQSIQCLHISDPRNESFRVAPAPRNSYQIDPDRVSKPTRRETESMYTGRWWLQTCEGNVKYAHKGLYYSSSSSSIRNSWISPFIPSRSMSFAWVHTGNETITPLSTVETLLLLRLVSVPWQE